MQHTLLGTEDIAVNKKFLRSQNFSPEQKQVKNTIDVMSDCDICYGEKYSRVRMLGWLLQLYVGWSRTASWGRALVHRCGK